MLKKQLWQIEDKAARTTATHSYINVDYHVNGQWYRARVGPILTESDRRMAELELASIIASFEPLGCDGHVIYETSTVVKERRMPPEPSDAG